MLFKIEAKNPFSGEIEYYAVVADSEERAKINFSMEFPSFKVRNCEQLQDRKEQEDEMTEAIQEILP